jgi:hypothetical protein
MWVTKFVCAEKNVFDHNISHFYPLKRVRPLLSFIRRRVVKCGACDFSIGVGRCVAIHENWDDVSNCYFVCAENDSFISHLPFLAPQTRAATSKLYSKADGKVWSWWLQYWGRPLRCHHRKIWIRPGDVLMVALSSRWKQQQEQWCERGRWWPRMPWRGCGHSKALVWWPGDKREGGFHLMVEFKRRPFFDESERRRRAPLCSFK